MLDRHLVEVIIVHKFGHTDIHYIQYIDIYYILLMYVYCKSVHTGSIPVPASIKINCLDDYFPQKNLIHSRYTVFYVCSSRITVLNTAI